MIEIVEVKTKIQQKQFVDFPTKLYKGVKQYVHPIRVDELALFSPQKNVSFDDCDVVYYLAIREGKVVGRVAGIIQKLYNTKINGKQSRFSRFDSINDQEVANALLSAVEKWAKDKGMETMHGPLGFNDQDREGLLIEGFDEISTFEEQYSYPYYKELIENYGFVKDTDWLEFKIYPPKENNERIEELAKKVLTRYDLHIVDSKNKTKFLNRYADDIFEVIDEAYSPLYGTVPFTEKLKNSLLSQFKLIIQMKFFIAIADKSDKIIGFGFAFPSLSKAMNKSKGRLFPFGIIRLLRALKNPKVVDLALVGLRQEYKNKGVNAIIFNYMAKTMVKEKIEYAETNLNLEDNIRIQQQWAYFPHVHHKRRRSFIKNID